MEHFTPVASAIGGALIGLSATMLLLSNGRIAGISGIAGHLLSPRKDDTAWRVAFVVGLAIAGAVALFISPEHFAVDIDRSYLAIAAAGLLVGFGTRLGSGCTSGHGICGLSRLSRRSVVSVVTFITTGAVTVAAVRTLAGGAL